MFSERHGCIAIMVSIEWTKTDVHHHFSFALRLYIIHSEISERACSLAKGRKSLSRQQLLLLLLLLLNLLLLLLTYNQQSIGLLTFLVKILLVCQELFE